MVVVTRIKAVICFPFKMRITVIYSVVVRLGVVGVRQVEFIVEVFVTQVAHAHRRLIVSEYPTLSLRSMGRIFVSAIVAINQIEAVKKDQIAGIEQLRIARNLTVSDLRVQINRCYYFMSTYIFLHNFFCNS